MIGLSIHCFSIFCMWRIIHCTKFTTALILFKGGCIDVKLTSDKIWILKDNGLVFHNLLLTAVNV